MGGDVAKIRRLPLAFCGFCVFGKNVFSKTYLLVHIFVI